MSKKKKYIYIYGKAKRETLFTLTALSVMPSPFWGEAALKITDSGIVANKRLLIRELVVGLYNGNENVLFNVFLSIIIF